MLRTGKEIVSSGLLGLLIEKQATSLTVADCQLRTSKHFIKSLKNGADSTKYWINYMLGKIRRQTSGYM